MKYGIILVASFIITGCGSSLNNAIKKVPVFGAMQAEAERTHNERQQKIKQAKAAGIPIYINNHSFNNQKGQLFSVKGIHHFSVEIENISGNRIKDIALFLNAYNRNGQRVNSQNSELTIVKSNKFLGKAPKGGTREWRVVLENNANCAKIIKAIIYMSDGSIKTVSKEQMLLSYPDPSESICGSKY